MTEVTREKVKTTVAITSNDVDASFVYLTGPYVPTVHNNNMAAETIRAHITQLEQMVDKLTVKIGNTLRDVIYIRAEALKTETPFHTTTDRLQALCEKLKAALAGWKGE